MLLFALLFVLTLSSENVFLYVSTKGHDHSACNKTDPCTLKRSLELVKNETTIIFESGSYVTGYYGFSINSTLFESLKFVGGSDVILWTPEAPDEGLPFFSLTNQTGMEAKNVIFEGFTIKTYKRSIFDPADVLVNISIENIRVIEQDASFIQKGKKNVQMISVKNYCVNGKSDHVNKLISLETSQNIQFFLEDSHFLNLYEVAPFFLKSEKGIQGNIKNISVESNKNDVSYSQGSAIVLENEEGYIDIHIDHSIFQKNEYLDSIIMITNELGDINIDIDSIELIGNKLIKNGIFFVETLNGVIYSKIVNSNFVSNSAKDGSALHFRPNDSFSILLKKNTFRNNYAINQNGSVISIVNENDQETFQSQSTLETIDNLFKNNSCEKCNGILSISSNIYNAFSRMDKFILNRALNGKGGALYLESEKQVQYDFVSTEFIENTAQDGGAIYFFNYFFGKMNAENTTFVRNSAVKGSGGVLYNMNVFNLVENSVISIFSLNKCKVHENTAKVSGGAFSNFENEYSDIALTIQKSEFSKNFASENGGAIEFYNSFFFIYDSNFVNNTVDGLYSKGGVLYTTRVFFTVNNSVFSDNYASFGGAIYSDDGMKQIFSGNSFTKNTANYGGAIYFNQGFETNILSNNTLTFNKADYGGALLVDYNSLHDYLHIDAKIEENTANVIGGGICFTDLIVDTPNVKDNEPNDCTSQPYSASVKNKNGFLCFPQEESGRYLCKFSGIEFRDEYDKVLTLPTFNPFKFSLELNHNKTKTRYDILQNNTKGIEFELNLKNTELKGFVKADFELLDNSFKISINFSPDKPIIEAWLIVVIACSGTLILLMLLVLIAIVSIGVVFNIKKRKDDPEKKTLIIQSV